MGSSSLEQEHGFAAREEQPIAMAAREELHLPVRLSRIGFKTER